MEPIILFLVIFFPAVFSPPPAEPAAFSTLAALNSLIIRIIPSLILIWYLITDKKGLPAMKGLKPKKQDLKPFFIGLSGLIFIGIIVYLCVKYLSGFFGFSSLPRAEAPFTIMGWFVMILACIGTGYLEESYFRYYLLIKFEVLNPAARLIIPAVLFSICHFYQGPWGILNAAAAALLLSAVFIRYKSLHGIAFAHGVYNIFVLIIGSVS